MKLKKLILLGLLATCVVPSQKAGPAEESAATIGAGLFEFVANPLTGYGLFASLVTYIMHRKRCNAISKRKSALLIKLQDLCNKYELYSANLGLANQANNQAYAQIAAQLNFQPQAEAEAENCSNYYFVPNWKLRGLVHEFYEVIKNNSENAETVKGKLGYIRLSMFGYSNW